MAHTTSALRTRASTEAQNNEGLPWTDAEVAVEVLKDAVGTGPTTLPAGTNILGKVGIDQTTPGTTNGVQLTGAQLTPVTSTVTTTGSVAAGKYSVEFIFSSDFAGTILTVAYAGATDAVKSFEAPAGRTLAAIAYTISAGSARLTTI